jgi:DNA polymerase-3 subunit beta
MKFICDKSDLLAALQIAGRAVASKSPMPALEGLLIQSQGNEIVITGYDLKTGIRTRVEASVDIPGSMVLNAKLFTDIVRNMPAGDLLTESEQQNVKISCFSSEFEILASSAEDYPELPSVDSDNFIRIPEGALRSIVTETLFAVSDDESKPVHTGSLFEISDGILTVVSVDGYRLALRRENINQYNGPLGELEAFVVPGTMLNELKNICADKDDPVAITVGSRYILFKVGDTEVISRRLEGKFLDYKRSIPEVNEIEIEADRRALLSVTERVSLIINDTLKSPLRLTVGDGVLKLKTTTPVGKANDECLIKGEGKNLEIGFNNRYLLDALKAAPADEIKLKFNTEKNPCIITSAESDNDSFLYMILPVKLAGN